jgi:hypothetical protein
MKSPQIKLQIYADGRTSRDVFTLNEKYVVKMTKYRLVSLISQMTTEECHTD